MDAKGAYRTTEQPVRHTFDSFENYGPNQLLGGDSSENGVAVRKKKKKTQVPPARTKSRLTSGSRSHTQSLRHHSHSTRRSVKTRRR